MVRRFLIVVLVLFSWELKAQKEVSQEVMEQIYEQIKTPYKYGLAIAPKDNGYKIDCPTVFREGDKWYMTYLVYNGREAKDGRGYQTWLAESDNLLEWKTLGTILSFRDSTWDCCQRGGFPALPEMDWGGDYGLQTYKGKHWMTYIGGEGVGYEAISAPLYIGTAWTNKNIGEVHEWESGEKPSLSIHDKDAQWWEKLTQYKSVVYWDKEKKFGYPFVMFYNAGGINPENNFKGERIGIALSKNMKTWKRYEGNPVFTHEIPGTITGDAHIQKIGDVYVMFYFSAFRDNRPYKAFNTFACSYDLIHWTDWNGDDLVIPSRGYDELFAHKSYVIYHEGVVYHFYCAVNKNLQRGIAIATSKPMGRSFVSFPEPDKKSRREELTLSQGWEMQIEGESEGWKRVSLPHNADDYYGYRQQVHGNLHGTVLYRNNIDVKDYGTDKRYFIRFDGVGTYATLIINGKSFGKQPVGRTSLTLDVTGALVPGQKNLIEVKAEHPAMITDMPWVCGGCSSEWGFSEGSQPMGIFRPVTLEVTDAVRVEPFGVHIWNDATASADSAVVYIETEIKNYSSKSETFELVSKLNNEDGIKVFRNSRSVTLQPGEHRIIKESGVVSKPKLWSPEHPYLYQLATVIKRDGKTSDEVTTPYGVRTCNWKSGDGTFRLNGEKVYLNGVCEYEHQFGQSHAFSEQQIRARVAEIKNAGFNAFRDAHQPHNLLYNQLWDEKGVLLWTQFSAHIWYDTPEFRENFKILLRRWVKERRNSPSLVIWGLQNESVLPADFAKECCDIIREMDPTAKNQRIITTCNGGEGSDWNVVQNWSGTYGGDPNVYDKEMKKQLMNGEYGAWRTLDLHTEGAFDLKGIWSEERMTQLLELKVRLAESVRDSICGQFQWIFTSHDNPGRRQPDEALRGVDKVGPFNYKGLLTPWEEPTEAYYMYRSNYVSAQKDPMVYIASHTWVDRFPKARRADIHVYSNCDSVLLYNDAAENQFLGRKKRGGVGTHFVWENRNIQYNVLRAVGYYKGRVVAEDVVVLNHLPKAPHFDSLSTERSDVLKEAEGYHYIYKVNCGGATVTDSYGKMWSGDVSMSGDTCGWGSVNWSDEFVGLHPFLGSQRYTKDPIKGVNGVEDWNILGTFRFGRHKLGWYFPLPDGTYRVEFYFIEPWHGTGGAVDCEGLRVFDVAVNGKTVIDDIDIWAQKGHDGAYKVVRIVEITGGRMNISFPEVKAGQAVISAIAIASTQEVKAAVAAHGFSGSLNTGMKVFDGERIVTLPSELYMAEYGDVVKDIASVYYLAGDSLEIIPNGYEKTTLTMSTDKRRLYVYKSVDSLWRACPAGMLQLRTPLVQKQKESNVRPEFRYEAEDAVLKGNFVNVFHKKQAGIEFRNGKSNRITWSISTGLAAEYMLRFRYMNIGTKAAQIGIRLIASDGRILKNDVISMPIAGEKWRVLSTTTGSFINAGHYSVELTVPGGVRFDALEVQ